MGRLRAKGGAAQLAQGLGDSAQPGPPQDRCCSRAVVNAMETVVLFAEFCKICP